LREAHPLHSSKNTVVFEQGEDACSFFVLLHGHVRAAKMTPGGHQIVVRYFSPGQTFGVAAALGRESCHRGTLRRAKGVVDKTSWG
jgi:CRP-like cAMP-binding protein